MSTITIANVGQAGGVKLESTFGEQGDPVFEKAIKELPVIYKTINY